MRDKSITETRVDPTNLPISTLIPSNQHISALILRYLKIHIHFEVYQFRYRTRGIIRGIKEISSISLKISLYPFYILHPNNDIPLIHKIQIYTKSPDIQLISPLPQYHLNLAKSTSISLILRDPF
ncbi:unnamed protein product [Meloidogyne enterolobii]|uniref:Uncharacterized protein n=1 Tax=Meloidogyne enterolobii TaxID=390850 RepID=A0ACB0XYI3_MELEN